MTKQRVKVPKNVWQKTFSESTRREIVLLIAWWRERAADLRRMKSSRFDDLRAMVSKNIEDLKLQLKKKQGGS